MNSTLVNIVKAGSLSEVEDEVRAALDAGLDSRDILDALTGALGEVGARFQRREIFVPEMLVSAMTVQRGVAVLRPLYKGEATHGLGEYIIGTVQGDLHDIGKNLVIMLLEAAGFQVIDLGVDVSPRRFVQALQSHPDCRVLGLSALLTTTRESMRETVAAIDREGLRDRVRIMVGGTPVTQAFADSIGADAYTENAAAAASRAVELIGR